MKEAKPAAITIRILCRLWPEDDVWNAVAEHLPVAVSGATFEEAQSNLSDALHAYLETVSEIGDLQATIAKLQEHARDDGFLTLTELAPKSAFVPMQFAWRDRELLQLT